MNTTRGILLSLIVGFGSLFFGVIYHVGSLKLGGWLALTVMPLYLSWKTRHHLSSETLMTVMDDYVPAIIMPPFFIFVGGTLMLDSLKKGNDHSGLLISAVVFCFGSSLVWKYRQAFSVKNIVYTYFIGISLIGFGFCVIGGIGFFTGYDTGNTYSAPIPLSCWQAVKTICGGLSTIGILALEIWLPDIDSCAREVLGKEPRNVSWSSF